MNQDLLVADVSDVMAEALATGLFVSLCTIQGPTGNLGPGGTPDGTYADIPGLIAIPCMAAPPRNDRILATEIKTLAEIDASALLHVLLDAWYPQIENGVSVGWRAIIDGTTFDILGAESDSQGQMTRMEVVIRRL
jgi:hypothetical protein